MTQRPYTWKPDLPDGRDHLFEAPRRWLGMRAAPLPQSVDLRNLPLKSEQNLGGHAVCAVGYDMTAKRLIVRNSWGSKWGQAGHFTMPFDYAANRNLADDFWTLRK